MTMYNQYYVNDSIELDRMDVDVQDVLRLEMVVENMVVESRYNLSSMMMEEVLTEFDYWIDRNYFDHLIHYQNDLIDPMIKTENA